MSKLLGIAALTLLAYFVSRWRYRLAATRQAGAAPAHKRQSGYFALATAALALIACIATMALSRLGAGHWVDSSLASQVIVEAEASGHGLGAGASRQLLLDNIRNRVAYPDLYRDHPASLLIDNAVNWHRSMQRMVDALAWTLTLLAAAAVVFWRLRAPFGSRASPQQAYEALVRAALMSISAIAILCSVGIVATLLIESVRFFAEVSPLDFLFGTQWSPQMAIRADQTAAQGAFGFVPLLTGTLLISAVAIGFAFPVGLTIAVYTSEYATGWQRMVIKPTLEILTGIPTVVYGAFAAIFAGPWLKDLFVSMGFSATVESALAVGVIMGIMIIPLVSSLIDDALRQIPVSIREGMLSIGATRLEMLWMALLPASMPGIVGALLLAISRAFGETMIVVMAAGLAAKLSFNPLEAVTTVTVQIATILVGDQVFDSIKTLSAFALGLTLFIITLSLNVLASWVSARYRVVYQ